VRNSSSSSSNYSIKYTPFRTTFWGVYYTVTLLFVLFVDEGIIIMSIIVYD